MSRLRRVTISLTIAEVAVVTTSSVMAVLLLEQYPILFFLGLLWGMFAFPAAEDAAGLLIGLYAAYGVSAGTMFLGISTPQLAGRAELGVSSKLISSLAVVGGLVVWVLGASSQLKHSGLGWVLSHLALCSVCLLLMGYLLDRSLRHASAAATLGFNALVTVWLFCLGPLLCEATLTQWVEWIRRQ